MRLQASIKVAFKAWMDCGEGRGGAVIIVVDDDDAAAPAAAGGGGVEGGSKAVLKVARRRETVWRVWRVGDVKRRT